MYFVKKKIYELRGSRLLFFLTISIRCRRGLKRTERYCMEETVLFRREFDKLANENFFSDSRSQ